MKTLLILRFSAMGDVAIAASVMKEIAAQHTDTQIVFVTRPFFAPFFDNISNLEVFSVDFDKKHKGFIGILRLYNELIKKYKIGYVADLHNVLRTKILTILFRLSFIKTAKINKGKKEKRALCNSNNSNKKPLTPTWQRYVDVFTQLGIKTEIKPKPIPFFPEKVKKIGVSPFAQHKGKIYPFDLLKKTLELLSVNYEIYLFGGGKNEKELCEKWQTKYKNVHSVVGKYSLREELKFISTLDVMLSMDSSGMHLASLCNIPCVSVWGATHPYSGFVGFGQANNPQIQINLPCRPCSVYGNKPCKFNDYRCLKEISPENIARVFWHTVLVPTCRYDAD